MNDQLREWIPAYADGQLTGTLREQVEAHLAECPTCQAELTELRQLSALLQSEPLTLTQTSEAFAHQVIDRLPGQREAAWVRGWWIALRALPLLLLLAWVFVQAVGAVSGTLLWGLALFPDAREAFGAALNLTAPAIGSTWLNLGLLNGLLGQPGPGLGWAEAAGTFVVVSGLMTLVFGVLFLGWAAGWFAFSRAIESNRS